MWEVILKPCTEGSVILLSPKLVIGMKVEELVKFNSVRNIIIIRVWPSISGKYKRNTVQLLEDKGVESRRQKLKLKVKMHERPTREVTNEKKKKKKKSNNKRHKHISGGASQWLSPDTSSAIKGRVQGCLSS